MNEQFINDLVAAAKEAVAKNGGSGKRPVKGSCAAVKTPEVVFQAAGANPKATVKPPPPTENDLRIAAERLGLTYNPPPVKVATVGAGKPKVVEHMIPGVAHGVALQPGSELRYSHRALKKLIMEDIARRGNGGEYDIDFDDLGAVITAR
jgi:hypothetical protein